MNMCLVVASLSRYIPCQCSLPKVDANLARKQTSRAPFLVNVMQFGRLHLLQDPKVTFSTVHKGQGEVRTLIRHVKNEIINEDTAAIRQFR